MKVIQSSLLRAVVAIIVGTLLIKFREESATWLTITVGVLFFLSGVISCAAYYGAKRHENDTPVYDANGKQLTGIKPTFPIVGVGSAILGIILAAMPGTFLSGLMYILAAILILGAINQFITLAAATRFVKVGFVFWLFPVVILLTAIFVIVKKIDPVSMTLFIIGWCMLVYGMAECLNSIKVYKAHKKQRAAEEAAAEEIQEAEEIEDKTTETPSEGNSTEEEKAEAYSGPSPEDVGL